VVPLTQKIPRAGASPGLDGRVVLSYLFSHRYDVLNSFVARHGAKSPQHADAFSVLVVTSSESRVIRCSLDAFVDGLDSAVSAHLISGNQVS